jgi:hypothetical protein
VTGARGGDNLISDYALLSMLTISTKPAPENLGPFSAFIIATAITGPVIINTSIETRNAAALNEAVFLIRVVMILILNKTKGCKQGEIGRSSF